MEIRYMKTREEQRDMACTNWICSQENGTVIMARNVWKAAVEWADSHPQWIPVEERLPEKDNEFEDYSKLVVVTNGKDFWKGMYNYGGEDWRTFDLWLIDDATHWMEIVPPRKEE